MRSLVGVLATGFLVAVLALTALFVVHLATGKKEPVANELRTFPDFLSSLVRQSI